MNIVYIKPEMRKQTKSTTQNSRGSICQLQGKRIINYALEVNKNKTVLSVRDLEYVNAIICHELEKA